ncbi:DNA mismatch repair protein MutS [Halalkalicoccus jeotgali]|uniref:DNA mismatch repair protein MutS n=1 Tax=Halalkalicoccus jeotgali (strain DSM 18796 / CECT 7217 / JCM 14584 / KCTC 4019 / B3) TaxID=795797 RepID=D8J712_HALJB|nr:DNA mismatch repair protein MutS [Halalkalicoccus jeotgali]ADJ15965.1 DNA mismatch repair protein MutS [Halalkalicoccus jeotgali B3]ELY38061.1 DNA mismatch repair protein MutS [Halalkalicoccus jeotgali B3]
MERALGAPAKMKERHGELTPMMRQYCDLCERYDESLVLFQVGDFYETFCEAAEVSARLLEITLTKREDSTGTYPMAGIPIDSAESYIETLLDAGFRVAVADQVQDPEEASGVVDRAVTRIVTPGTLTEAELLRSEDNNYVAALAEDESGDEREYGLAFLDVSTGDFVATGAISEETIRDEISRFAPAEAIVGPGLEGFDGFDSDCMVTPYDPSRFALEGARELLDSYFGTPEKRLASDAEIRACGALLSYAEYARGGQDGRLDYLNHLTRYEPREYMLLDRVAFRSLELFEPRAVGGDSEHTILGVLDETACALGRRKLTDWLRRPLLDRARIEARLDAVSEWTTLVGPRETVHDLLSDVYDIERLIARVSRGRANARDLRALKDTLDRVPEIRAAMAGVESDTLHELREGLDELEGVRELIDRAIAESPPIEITEGDVIAPGYDADLDGLRETEREGKEWIDSLEARERERTGVDSLKVGFNQVHGYYIEVTNPNLERVPENYTRRQTLKNSERFYTPELKQREDEIITAEERADDLEYELFVEVRQEVAGESERVQAVAETLATLDVLVSLAAVAAKYGYARPEIDEEPGIAIEGGRHPVVERTQESFVPNGAELTPDERLAVLTGPNMSGKSTYMRQIALITILAQIGSFVPASRARIGIVDRVFTRVGASDDIAGGRSTFMVEMSELATILRGASERSLVLLDEVGRGTSTADGLAIARAITEYVHSEVGALTLFATHHHELTELADALAGGFNLHFAATQTDDGVTFRHDVSRGAATASYGIEVARAAGVPDRVVERSRALVAEGSPENATDGGETIVGSRTLPNPDSDDNPSSGGPAPSSADGELTEALRALDVANMTPIEALTTLDRLKHEANED